MPSRADKLTVNPEDLEYIWQQIKLSHRYHEPFVAKGRETIEYREGRRFTSFVATEYRTEGGAPPRVGRVPINLFQTYHEILRPTLTGSTWRPVASTHSSSFYAAAQREEDLIAWNQEVTDFDSEVEMVAIDRLDYGRGVIKTGIGEPFGMRAMDVALSQPTIDPMTGLPSTLGNVMRDVVGAANGTGRSNGDEEHPDHGSRRYPKGAVWQRRISPEDVWGDHNARHPKDSRYMVQKHYLPERVMKQVLKRMNISPRVLKDLLPYTLRVDFDFLEQELDKKRGTQWEELQQQVEKEKIYKMYEFWWREENKLIFLIDGIEDRPVLARRWGAPEGEYPFEYFDRPTRGDRAHPEPEFNGLQADQDQINIANSMLTDVVRRGKALVAVMEQYVEPDDIKLIEEGGGLAVIRLKRAMAEVLQTVQIQQDIKPLMQLIVHIYGHSRQRHGITLEQTGAASPTETATQSLILDQSAKVLTDDRMRGMHTFLTKCVQKHSRYNRLAFQNWPPAKRQGAAIYDGAMGLPKGQEAFYDMQEEGFTREEILYEKRWRLEVMAQSPSDRDEQLKRTDAIINMHGNSGWLNMREMGIYQLELAQVDRRGLVLPDPEDRDPAEEHSDILLGIPINQSPHEDHARHFAKHKKFIIEVLTLANMQEQGRPQKPQFPVTADHFQYLKDIQKGGEKFQILMDHAQGTEKLMGGGGGSQSMSQQGAMDTNRMREGQGKQGMRAEAGKPIPFGAENTKLSQAAGVN